MPFIFSLLVIALMIGALIDIITRDDSRVRFLPKMVWIIIVILLPLIGSILWFALGREYSSDGVSMPRIPRRARSAGPASAPPQAPPRPVDTRTTEQQIADLDREIEEWRLRQEIEKRRQERGED
ncbi:PLDc N-terminal domain-containing protein [Microbacterium sp. M28]|uniref:PLDc N-terminal domain-containing protein n=1 Tax=Microbacterium sp. M28 TaxID=2962064 RepID=UPI0021F42AA9|nr:PLDc N-terminal domain-containing protein [Microbacterium sp. M28]UYO96173.1 PLDc N-terminal domain-containing protein [Microbacterium sp. M28]